MASIATTATGPVGTAPCINAASATGQVYAVTNIANHVVSLAILWLSRVCWTSNVITVAVVKLH